MSHVRLCVALAFVSATAFAAQPVVTFSSAAADATGCDMRPLDNSDGPALSCAADFDRGAGGTCTAVFRNYGTASCVGTMIMALGPATQGTADNGQAAGPINMLCRRVGNVPLPGSEQTGVPNLDSAVACEGTGIVPVGSRMTVSARITPSAFAVSPFKVGVLESFKTTAQTNTYVIIGQGTLAQCNLILSVPGVARSGNPYTVRWTPAAAQTSYEVQQAAANDFANATTTVTSNTTAEFTNNLSGPPRRFFYRVRATSCRGGLGPYSAPEDVIVIPELPPSARSFDISLLQGSQTPINQQVKFDKLRAGAPFTATVDRPYLTVTPAIGIVASDGTATVTVRVNPQGLPFGANKGTVTITVAAAKTGGGVQATADNTSSKPVSVTITSPVTAAPKTPPPPATWVIPAVAHKDGIGAQFVSDVKLANVNTTVTASYQLTYTPSDSDGSVSGRTTKIDLSPGQMAAIGDILKNVFGLGTTTADASGVLEIRTLSTPAPGTIAGSRTYSEAAAEGTFGQFIPAVAISRVATPPATSTATPEPLILSHVSQSAVSRLNLGLVEALGFATTGVIKVYDASGVQFPDPLDATRVLTIPFSLRPFEHQQINSFFARNGITTSSARIDISVDSAAEGATTGGITAYAAQLDNMTQDGSVVPGVKASAIKANRFILPGVSEGTTTGEHSEVRVFNAGTSAVTATMTFYREGAANSPIVRTEAIAAGQIKSYDNVVASLFGTTGRGSFVVSTTEDSTLLVTGRTFTTSASGGTSGEFQLAQLAADGIGSADGELQLLQLEESDKFRSDVALAELTGNAAEVQISLIAPDGKSAPSTRIPLAANEFMNLEGVIASMGATGNVYNARITLKVVSGTGRVGAYASMVDRATNDPTLFPGQR